MDESYIYQKLFSLVQSLFENHVLRNYFGVHLSMKVIKHVNDCIVIESHKKQRDNFIARCSAILCSLPLFFSIKKIAKYIFPIFPKNNGRLIKDICTVVSLIHIQTIPSDNSVLAGGSWKLFPRYCFLLEQINLEGCLRSYYYEKCNAENLEYVSFLRTYRKKIKSYAQELEKCGVPSIIHLSREQTKKVKKDISPNALAFLG